MRPVRRGVSPRESDYSDYKDAKTELVSRISSGWINEKHVASYCSYCERKIDTNLAVEHIEPKNGKFAKPNLIGRWSNFLLACVNCNSTKGAKKVDLKNIFLPDRDNTFIAFEYLEDGSVIPNKSLSSKDTAIANKTLTLLGLDKTLRETYDARDNLIAQDRASQRMNILGTAEYSLEGYERNLGNETVANLIVNNMIHSGFFSVWMKVFHAYPEMKNRFIDAIHGTRVSGCFNLDTSDAVSPHSNRDELLFGGKI